jgi:hypothetical protein
VTDTTHLDGVRQVFERRKGEILATYNAVGAGIGKEEDSYTIVVYLATAKDRPEEPASVEGVPLRFVVTGPIRPLLQKAR